MPDRNNRLLHRWRVRLFSPAGVTLLYVARYDAMVGATSIGRIGLESLTLGWVVAD